MGFKIRFIKPNIWQLFLVMLLMCTEKFKLCVNVTPRSLIDLRGGYTSDFFIHYFCVRKQATHTFYMLGSYKWYEMIALGFYFEFGSSKFFQLFTFLGNPRRKFFYFSKKYFFQIDFPRTFFEISSKFQNQVLDDINGHLTRHGISSITPAGRSTAQNMQTW